MIDHDLNNIGFPFFQDEGVSISIFQNNSKMHKIKTWEAYMIQYWVEEKIVEHCHSNQNTFQRDLEKWKSDIIKVVIGHNVDPRVWF